MTRRNPLNPQPPVRRIPIPKRDGCPECQGTLPHHHSSGQNITRSTQLCPAALAAYRENNRRLKLAQGRARADMTDEMARARIAAAIRRRQSRG